MKPALVGFHPCKDKNILTTIQGAMMLGANAVQFFLSSPKVFALANPLSNDEIDNINKLKRDETVYTVIHGKYLYNFCRAKKWQHDALLQELEIGHKIGSDVVIHQGKNVADLGYNHETALNEFVKNVSDVVADSNKKGHKSLVLLENSCQQGTELGYTIDELAVIYNMFEPAIKKRIGFCLDLCHIYVSGSLNVSDPLAVRTFFNEFDTKIGLKHLKVIHFNDSNTKFCSKNDNHHDLLVGYIGAKKLGGNPDGLREVAKLAYKHNIPMIMETPGHADMVEQILLVRSWIADMADLEPEYREKYDKLVGNDLAGKKGRKKGNCTDVSKTKLKIKIKPIKK